MKKSQAVCDLGLLSKDSLSAQFLSKVPDVSNADYKVKVHKIIPIHLCQDFDI
jgi:hypothetical protein